MSKRWVLRFFILNSYGERPSRMRLAVKD